MAQDDRTSTNLSAVARDSDMHKAYVLLCSQSVETLREIYKFWDVSQHFTHSASGKAVLIAQIVTFIYDNCVAKSLSTIRAVLEGDEWEYSIFQKKWALVYQKPPLPVIPALSDIASGTTTDVQEKVKQFPELVARGRSSSSRSKRKAESPAKSKGTALKESRMSKSTAAELTAEKEVTAKPKPAKQKPFSLSEFTRLMLLIRDDPECRPAYLRASQTITKRNEMDVKRKPVDEWVNVIEKRYNNSSLRTRQALEYLFDEPNTPEDPPICFRPGAYLRSVSNRFRTLSSLPFANFRRSGQNNPNFKKFMETDRSKKCYSLSERDRKRVIVGAVVFGLGTENEDVEILNVAARTIDYAGNFGHEGGAGRFDMESQGGASGARSTSRERSSGEFQEDGMKVFESASSYFKTEEKERERDEEIEEQNAKNARTSSKLKRIGNRRKLLDELAVAKAKVEEGVEKEEWQQKVDLIKQALKDCA